MSRRLHRQSSGVSLAVVFPVAGLGTILLALAAATGKLRHWIEALPLPEPGINGYPFAVLITCIVGFGWRLSRIRPAERQHLDRLLALDEADRDNEKWPDAGNELFGTFPFTVAPQPRRLHPAITAEDLDPDPEQLNPTVLPVRPERRVRS